MKIEQKINEKKPIELEIKPEIKMDDIPITKKKKKKEIESDSEEDDILTSVKKNIFGNIRNNSNDDMRHIKEVLNNVNKRVEKLYTMKKYGGKNKIKNEEPKKEEDITEKLIQSIDKKNRDNSLLEKISKLNKNYY